MGADTAYLLREAAGKESVFRGSNAKLVYVVTGRRAVNEIQNGSLKPKDCGLDITSTQGGLIQSGNGQGRLGKSYRSGWGSWGIRARPRNRKSNRIWMSDGLRSSTTYVRCSQVDSIREICETRPTIKPLLSSHTPDPLKVKEHRRKAEGFANGMDLGALLLGGDCITVRSPLTLIQHRSSTLSLRKVVPNNGKEMLKREDRFIDGAARRKQ